MPPRTSLVERVEALERMLSEQVNHDGGFARLARTVARRAALWSDKAMRVAFTSWKSTTTVQKLTTRTQVLAQMVADTKRSAKRAERIGRAMHAWAKHVAIEATKKAFVRGQAVRAVRHRYRIQVRAWKSVVTKAKHARLVKEEKRTLLRHTMRVWRHTAKARRNGRMRRLRDEAFCTSRKAKRTLANAIKAWRDQRKSTNRRSAKRQRAFRLLTKHFYRLAEIIIWEWQDVTHRNTRKRILIKKCIGKIRNITKSAAFRGFKNHATQQRQQRRRAAYCARQILRHGIARALRGWSENVRDTVAKRKRAAKCVARICNMRMAVALDGWRTTVESDKLKRSRLEKCIVRIHQLELAGAFDGWHDRVVSLTSSRSRALRAVTRIRNMLLSSAMHSWCSTAETMRSGRDRARQVVVRLVRYRESIALEGWRAEARRISYLRGVAQRAMAALCQRCERKAFSKWHLETARSMELEALARRALLSMQHRALWQALCGFRYAIDMKKESKSMAMRAFQSLTQTTLRRAWNAWYTTSTTMRTQRQRASHCARQIIRHGMARALRGWSENVHVTVEKRHRAAKCVARIRNMRVAVALDGWRSASLDAHRHRSLLRRAASAFRWHDMRRGFMGWCVIVQYMQAMRSVVSRHLGRLRYRSAWHAWNQWRERIELKHLVDGKRDVLTLAIRRVMHVRQSAAFRGFQNLVSRCDVWPAE